MEHTSPHNSNEIIRINSDDQDMMSSGGLNLGKSKNLNRNASIDRYANDQENDDIDDVLDRVDTAILTLKELVETNQLKKNSIKDFLLMMEEPGIEPFVQKSDFLSQLYNIVHAMQNERDSQARQELKE